MGKEGYLKLAGGLMGGEKKRYFVLDDDNVLHYFKEKGKEEVGTVDMSKASVREVDKKGKKKIELKEGKTSLLLGADDGAAVTEWHTALSAVAGAVAAPKLTADDFELLKVIGKGSFGKVMQVRKKDTKKVYAMKVLSKKYILENNEVEHTLSERKILEKLNHPFMINMEFSFQTDDKLYFILEFVNGGELFYHLQQAKRFDEARSRFYAAEIALVVEFLHANGVIYRDLKPENLLLSMEGHIKLTDMGLSKSGLKEDDDRTGTFCGTPEYLAPEILKGQGYTKAVDWWSFASLLFEMLTGLPPFYSQDVQEMYRKIMTEPLKFPDIVSEPAKALLTDMLKRDLTQRLIDPAEIKAHAFFEPINWDDLYNLKIAPPYKPPVTDAESTEMIDVCFTEEAPSTNLGDGADDVQDAGAFDGFTFVDGGGLG